MRLYLDNCCFNRPFDDQSQLLVRLQTEAKLSVQASIRSGEHSLAWSAILDLENMGNPDAERRTAIDAWRYLAEVDIITTPEVERMAVELETVGLKPLDALHMASAITADAHVFLTTDKGILRKMRSESRIRVLDPLDFISQYEGEVDEN